jgi:adenine deaminase
MRDSVRPAVRARAVAAARGRQPFDVLLTGATVVDVGLGQLVKRDVGIVGELIASVHEPGSRTDAATVFDCSDRFLAPGFIDMHVHFESSMLTPAAYAAAICPRGTTTVYCDPHELANVSGLDGVRYAIEASRGLPVRFLVQAPSCVPPQPGLELSGHDLTADDVAAMLGWPEVQGVAEIMDMQGVLDGDERMTGVVAAGLASGKILSGHGAGLAGADLQAYVTAGIDSDHEIFADGDVRARLAAGMTVELRGAAEALLPAIVAELNAFAELPTHLVACTDDLFAATLLDDGGIDHLLRRLVAEGLSPVRAIRIATYHAAYRLGRNDLGLVAPGRLADIVVLSSLDEITVDDVFTAGEHVASAGQLLEPLRPAEAAPPLHTVHVAALSADSFVVRLDESITGRATLRAISGIILTEWTEVDVDVLAGEVQLPPGWILQAVIHRHGREPAIPQLALCQGWGENWNGAIATTVSHDTHNLVVFGRDPIAMATAANATIASHGGVAVARGEEILAQIELPIAGILSPGSCVDVANAQRQTLLAARSVGLPVGQLSQPLLQVLASSLACLPGPHVTDLGIADVASGELVRSLLVSTKGAR